MSEFSMSLTDLSIIKEAVMIQHYKPNTDSFRKAHEFLDRFRESPTCISCCFQLVSLNEPDEIRHFSLQSIILATKKNWERFSDAEKDSIRGSCFKFIREGSKGVLDEKNFIKEKIVDFVITVMIIDWPHKWTKVFKDLFEISKESESSLELVMMILRGLRNETEINYKLPLQKRENIKQSLRSYNNDIYCLIEATFQICLDKYTNSDRQTNEYKLSERLIHAGLECLGANIQYPLEAIFKNEMIDILCKIAMHPPFFKKGFECINSICNKKPILPQNTPIKKYKKQFYLIWRTIVDTLEIIVKESQKAKVDEEYYEILFEACSHLVKNHKNVVYHKVNGKDLKSEFVLNLTKVFSIERDRPLIFLFELWKTLFDVKFFTGMAEFDQIKTGLFHICFEKINTQLEDFNTFEDLEEVKTNLQGIVMILMKIILNCDSDLFFKLVIDHLRFLVQNTVNGPPIDQCTKESKIFLYWDNFFKVLRIPFYSGCFNFFRTPKQQKQKEACENILELLLFECKYALISDMIVKFYVKFNALFYANRDSFNTVLRNLWSNFSKFSIRESGSQSEVELKSALKVRKSTVNCFILLSKTCKSLFLPLFDSMLQNSFEILKNTSEMEDLSGVYEFLLNISEDPSLEQKRNKIIEHIFKTSVLALLNPDVNRHFNEHSFSSLLANTAEASQLRLLTRSSINALNSLLYGLTKAKVSYATDNRNSQISLFSGDSSQLEQIWTTVQQTYPVVATFSRGLNGFCSGASTGLSAKSSLGRSSLDLGDDLRAIFLCPAASKEILEKLKPDLQRYFYAKSVCEWLSDVRELSFSFLSLCCNLNNEFFTLDPTFIIKNIFFEFEKVPIRHLRSITEKIVSPYTIRCCAATPQYLSSFLAPLLVFYFQIISTRLCKEWEKFVFEDKNSLDTEQCKQEVEQQTDLRILTRSVSKYLYSLSLEIRIKSPFSSSSELTKDKLFGEEREKTTTGRGNPKNKTRQEAQDEVAFRVNKEIFNFLFGTSQVFEPLCRLLVFFLFCPDSISRNNVYRFLSQLAVIMGKDQKFLELLAKLMVEALKAQPTVKEVDESLVDFVNFLLFRLTSLKNSIAKNFLTQNLTDVNSEDIEFLLNSFRSRDKSLQKKKTKQFLLKLSGEEGVEISVEKTGVITGSVTKKNAPSRFNGGRRMGSKTNYVDPVNLSILFDEIE